MSKPAGRQVSLAGRGSLLERLAETCSTRRRLARERLSELHRDGHHLREKTASDTVEHLLLVEKAQLLERVRTGLLSRDAFDDLAKEVDEKLVRLRYGQFDDALDLIAPPETESASVAIAQEEQTAENPS